jgi:carbohydrate kinase (thermoresistant glucokinase family)
MGVSGSGKTTVGRALAEALHCTFLDADDFHPRPNVDKMAAGIALTDDDRWPWLDRLAEELHRYTIRGDSVVVACSALRQRYRDRLARASIRPGDMRFVYLKGDAATIASRLDSRRGHYMPATLLASQFADLEEPGEALAVDIRGSLQAQVEFIISHLGVAP